MKSITRLITAFVFATLISLAVGSAEAAKKDFQGTLNINTASVEELQQLPGIGKTKAEAIVAYRQAHPFKAVSEITEVKGIGPKMFEKIQSHLTVDGTPGSASEVRATTP